MKLEDTSMALNKKVYKSVYWIHSFLIKKQKEISKIRHAGGCRELWVQGEIYLYLNDEDVLTNATQSKYDVYKEEHFVLEIKFLGGHYQRKVLKNLSNDFDKLSKHDGREPKFVLLILDTSEKDTDLYDELYDFKHPKGRRCFREPYSNFYAILWKVS
jgi:hypothetical protein